MSSQNSENIPAQPPRPANAFLCFRSRFLRDRKAAAASRTDPEGSKGSHMSDVSREAAQRWNSMSAEERRPYFDMASRIREEHKVAYPDYKFSPSKKGAAATASKSAVPRARPAHRRAQTTRGPREPEAGPSFTHSNGGAPNLIPTLSSSYSPPVHRGNDNLYVSQGTARAPNESSQFSVPRSGPPQFGMPAAPYYPPDGAFMSGSSRPPSPDSEEAARHGFDPTLLLFEPEDFRSLCEWDNDFSQSYTAGSTSGTYYQSY
ncbi:high mobility group box domain-containing protein [Mycena haematopus]|nr:high mobility group box domain-containing protein [Mycena haematopus]